MNNLLINLKAYLKFLGKNKGYTAIDLFGLSVSLMFVLLIAVYTWQELSTDQFQEKKERIYFIGNENYSATGAAIAYRLKDRYPEIEKVCPMVIGLTQAPMESEGVKLNTEIMFADSTFFDLFSFKLLQGDPRQALMSTNEAILSQSFARKAFGTDEVVGRTFSIDTLNFIVGGVVEDFKYSSIPEADILLTWRMVAKFNHTLAPDQLSNAGGTVCAILVHEGVDFKSRAADIKEWFSTFFWPYERKIWEEVRLETLKDFYFSGWSSWPLKQGDRRFVLILLSVGVLILIFAILNYINLSVAQAGFRAKEMATRRLLGSSRLELFWRLMMESVAMCTLAMFLAIIFALAIAPHAGDLLQRQLDMKMILSPVWLLLIIGFILLVGGISGWLPAVVISNAKPIEVVRGTLRMKTKMTYSKVFITFQNFITIVMLSCSLVMILQLRHLINAPIGYNTKNLYVAHVSPLEASAQRTFLNKLSSISSVTNSGLTQGLPLFGSNNWTTYFDDGGIQRNISFQEYPMDRSCFEILGLKMIQDNQLANPKWYFNEEALRQMNLSKDAKACKLEHYDTEGNDVPISGIISDFHEGNITARISPVMLRFLKPEEGGWTALIEIAGDPFPVVKEIGKVYEEVSGGIPMEGYFYDDIMQKSFESQIRLTKIVGVFTGIAILISLLGLLAMSTYFIQQRSMEIAVRKVFGSDNNQILSQLIKSFMFYVVIAFFIAIPVAHYFMQQWLADYSYRIDLGIGIYLCAGLFSLMISFFTVFWQSYKAANTNPKETMKNL